MSTEKFKCTLAYTMLFVVGCLQKESVGISRSETADVEFSVDKTRIV